MATQPRQIPDSECVQSKCACVTTGCWNECNLKRFPVQIATPPAAKVADAILTWQERSNMREFIQPKDAIPHMLAEIAELRAALASRSLVGPTETAKQRYDHFTSEEAPDSPLERLRFFCSLAMAGRDWLDVEPFFDALAAQPPQASGAPELQGQASFDEWWYAGAYPRRKCDLLCGQIVTEDLAREIWDAAYSSPPAPVTGGTEPASTGEPK